jgi:hypothetical protein
MGYRSPFEGYRGFTEQPVVSWREANELVGRIGGWQAYAREGQAPVKAAPETRAPAAPAAASAPPPGGHSGHKMP